MDLASPWIPASDRFTCPTPLLPGSDQRKRIPFARYRVTCLLFICHLINLESNPILGPVQPKWKATHEFTKERRRNW
jgi:hypothetical protein